MSIDLDKPIYDFLDIFRSYFSNDYIYALFIFFMFLVVAFLITLIYKFVFVIISNRTSTKIDDMIVKSANRPIYLFVMIVGLKTIIAALEMNGGFIDNLMMALNSCLVIILTYIMVIVFKIFISEWENTLKRKTKSKYSDTIVPLIEKIIYLFFIFSGIIIVLDIWGVEVAPFLAGLGIAGIAIGLAVQDSLKDFIGGVNLILDNTYKVGEKVKLDTGEVGDIYAISIRSTRIRTYDNNVIIIPNHIMAASKIINYAQPRARERGEIPFGVVYGSSVEKTKKAALEALKNVEGIMEDPAPQIEFLDMGDSSLNFRALFWANTYGERWDLERKAVECIYEELTMQGIDFAFPTRTIYLAKDEPSKGN
ncbi:MAG TPA: mechanosensitive ion channel family protein [Candidatus Methanofastidiosa archaeon]|nr:mechanosensitive ion channel family protein [Candidatus Methanofastidiosa archaeon]HPR41880.1 mechanosensitive ion channel family protein [Candidatus Methanofastidiosa archaeon]